jgi:hypothetical protein
MDMEFVKSVYVNCTVPCTDSAIWTDKRGKPIQPLKVCHHSLDTLMTYVVDTSGVHGKNHSYGFYCRVLNKVQESRGVPQYGTKTLRESHKAVLLRCGYAPSVAGKLTDEQYFAKFAK